MPRFDIQSTTINGLNVISRHPISDERGYMERLFCADELSALVGPRLILQVNRTLTKKAGTIRGMHFQHPPHAEMKFVSCLRGEIFDVAVDLRKGSASFMQWHAEHLSAENRHTLVIPEGFAHGFQTLTNDCELLYLHTAAYQPDAEGGYSAQDSQLAINWPLPVTEMSIKDGQHPDIGNEFLGIEI